MLKQVVRTLRPSGVVTKRFLLLNTTTTQFPQSHDVEAYTTPSFIDNKFFKSESSVWYDVHDPATNRVISKVPQNTPEEMERAIALAHEAFDTWKSFSIIKRQGIAFKFVELLKANFDRLAAMIVLEQGKTFPDAKGDVLRGLQVAESACSVQELMGANLEVAADMETKMVREPLGVVASICPFNFPAMVPLWTIPLILVTGNTAILKPSERVPGAAMIICELLKEAGVPSGVINIIHGKHDSVNKILDDPRIKAITFVGGDKAGKYIYEKGTASGKRVQSNMGAKNHLIVTPDATKDQFINAVTGAAFGAAGQRCMAISVLVTVGETKNWVEDIAADAEKLVVGSGFHPTSDLGPLINPTSLTRANEIIAKSEEQGAKVVLDGRNPQLPAPFDKGNFLFPTILSEVDINMECYKQEIFGPVLSVVHVDTLDEAISVVNANKYGNGVSLFTNSGSTAQKFVKNIACGQVGVNVPIPVPLPMFSFTGNKASFLGDLNFYGRAGITFLTQPKTITTLWRTDKFEYKTPSTSMPVHD